MLFYTKKSIYYTTLSGIEKKKYVQYLRRHIAYKMTVVFDDYSDQFMIVPAKQQQFSANIHNKSRFISMLRDKLTSENIIVKRADNDNDVLIIEILL